MAFPSHTESVPSLSEYQASFQGYTFGYNTAFELTKIDGIELPAVRSGDAGRPRDHGLFVGLDVMGGREITFTGQFRTDSTSFQHAWNALTTATVPDTGTEQLPLYLNLPGYGTLVTLARVRKRQMPIDIKWALGNLADVTLLFAASDPRMYSTPTQLASVSAPPAAGGFTFPLTFPFSFHAGTVAGALDITNSGDIETRPILTVEGPCTDPSITNASAAGAPTLTWEVKLNAGDKLVIDTDMHTATLYTSGSTIGSTRLYDLALGSQWWTLAPGTSTIQFLTSTGEPEGTLYIEWASAFAL